MYEACEIRTINRRAEFEAAVFAAVYPIMLAEARSESRHLNPWFSSRARGLPPSLTEYAVPDTIAETTEAICAESK